MFSGHSRWLCELLCDVNDLCVHELKKHIQQKRFKIKSVVPPEMNLEDIILYACDQGALIEKDGLFYNKVEWPAYPTDLILYAIYNKEAEGYVGVPRGDWKQHIDVSADKAALYDTRGKARRIASLKDPDGRTLTVVRWTIHQEEKK